MRALWILPLLLLAGCESARRPGCRDGQMPPDLGDPEVPGLGFHSYTHSHNDYEQPHPLYDALDARFDSVEADVYYGDGTFPVSHDGSDVKGTLQALYLDPLVARVAEKGGSVYGDERPFYLVVDIKESRAELPAALHALLGRYEILTEYTDDSVRSGPVNVILSGDDGMKAQAIDFPARRAARDDNDYSPDDRLAYDNRWLAYALDWRDYFAWDGQGTLRDPELTSMDCIVEDAHFKGRSVRFFDGPDVAEAWRAQLGAGVRFIGTDRLVALDDFLDTIR